MKQETQTEKEKQKLWKIYYLKVLKKIRNNENKPKEKHE